MSKWLLALLGSWAVVETTAYLGLVTLGGNWSPGASTRRIASDWVESTRLAARHSQTREELPEWTESRLRVRTLAARVG